MSTMTEDAINLIQSGHEASLGTIEDGRPYVSAVGYVYGHSKSAKFGSVFILISDLARHSKNIQKNPAVSLLIVESSVNSPIHERRRATVLGSAKRVEDKENFLSLKQKYLEHFPKASLFFTLPDFRFYEIAIDEIHWIGGFGKAETIK